MCEQLRGWLGVVKDNTVTVITFGGFAMAIWVYLDFREVVREQAETAAKTAEILRVMDTRLSNLEHSKSERSNP